MKTKHLLSFIFSAILIYISLPGQCGNGTKASPYKIFWIGNSNTYMWGWYPSTKPDQAADPMLPKRVKEMAAKAPRPVYMNYTYKMRGGSNLEWHWLNGAQDSIKKGNYDFVVLNDHSTATFAYPDKFQKYSKLFDSLCKAHGAKPIFFMGWPDDDQWTLRRDVIINSYDKLAKDLNSELAPMGRAWELIEKRDATINLFQDDKHHPNELGVYMNACVFYSIITNTSPVNTAYYYAMSWAKPTAKIYETIQNAAWDACRERLDPNNEITLSYKTTKGDAVFNWTKPAGTAPALYALVQNATKIFYTKDTTFTIAGADPSMMHTYSVLGLKSDTLPLYNSNGISFKIVDMDAPTVPTNLKILLESTNFVSVQWDASTDNAAVKEYIVYLNGVEYKRTSSTQIAITGLVQDKEYKVQVAASDAAPNVSLKSQELVFTLKPINSTNINESELNIQVYPNPASQFIMIEAPVGAYVQLFDVKGILRSSVNIIENGTQLDLSNLDRGLFIITVTVNGICENRRFVKQ